MKTDARNAVSLSKFGIDYVRSGVVKLPFLSVKSYKSYNTSPPTDYDIVFAGPYSRQGLSATELYCAPLQRKVCLCMLSRSTCGSVLHGGQRCRKPEKGYAVSQTMCCHASL